MSQAPPKTPQLNLNLHGVQVSSPVAATASSTVSWVPLLLPRPTLRERSDRELGVTPRSKHPSLQLPFRDHGLSGLAPHRTPLPSALTPKGLPKGSLASLPWPDCHICFHATSLGRLSLPILPKAARPIITSLCCFLQAPNSW